MINSKGMNNMLVDSITLGHCMVATLWGYVIPIIATFVVADNIFFIFHILFIDFMLNPMFSLVLIFNLRTNWRHAKRRLMDGPHSHPHIIVLNTVEFMHSKWLVNHVLADGHWTACNVCHYNQL